MLYEPSNIIPSILTQTGTVAQASPVNVQWQVNGTSSMLMFQIDVSNDNAQSDFVYTTGVVSQYLKDGQNLLPFYGKNRFGEYVPFVYTPDADWGTGGSNSSNWGIVDGNRYKLSILQFFKANNVILSFTTSKELTSGNTYYFATTYTDTIYYVSFVCVNAELFPVGTKIYYSLTNAKGWILTGTQNRAVVNLTFSLGTSVPGGNSLGSGVVLTGDSNDIFYNTDFTVQNAQSAFITRTAPELTVASVASPLTTASFDFSATYIQQQGDNINYVRWQLFNNDDLGTPIDDTGNVYTQILEYEYNGFFTDMSYTLVCTIQTANGIIAEDSITFNVEFDSENYTGEFNTQILCNDEGVLLTWDGAKNIPAIADPENGYVLENGNLSLDEGAKITWNQIYNDLGVEVDINFDTPWSLAWRGSVSQLKATYISTIQAQKEFDEGSVVLSPNGELLILYGNFIGGASVFSVAGTTVTYVADITKNGAALFGNVSSIKFSPDGSKLVIIGGGTYASLFTVNGTTITLLKELSEVNDDPLGTQVKTVNFSPTSDLLVITGGIYTDAWIYSINGNTVQYSGNGIQDGSGIYLYTNRITVATFSPDGSLYLFCNDATPASISPQYVCRVEGTTITAFARLLDDKGEALNGFVSGYRFTADGNYLFVYGSFPNKAAVYRVEGENITFVRYFMKGRNSDTPYDEDESVFSLILSPDERAILLGVNTSSTYNSTDTDGYTFNKTDGTLEYEGWNFDISYYGSGYSFQGYVPNADYFVQTIRPFTSSKKTYIYRISPGSLVPGPHKRLGEIYYQNQSMSISDAVFSNDGKTLYIGSSTIGVPSIYSVTSSILDCQINYFGAIQKKVLIGGSAQIAALSPDGTKAIIGGAFEGYASLFTVSGTTLTYAGDIQKGGVALNNSVIDAAFSPDGTLAILGGLFSGYASIFAVNGTTLNYIGDITKNGVALDSAVSVIAFSPDGTKVVIGGAFSGNAALFTVSGTTLTYVGDVQKNGTALGGTITNIAFSPDGTKVVIGGVINDYALLYSVSDTALTYVGAVQKNGTALDGVVNICTFNASGDLLVVGGLFSGYASIFAVNGTTLNYIGDITKNGAALDSAVSTAMFALQGNALLLGGSFTDKCSLFSVDNDTVTYVSALTMGGVVLDNNVNAIAVPSNQNIAIIVGDFSGIGGIWQLSGAITEGKIIELNDGDISISRVGGKIQVAAADNVTQVDIAGSQNGGANGIVVFLTPNMLSVYSFLNNTYLGQQLAAITFTQPNISSVTLIGQQVCDYIAVFEGNGDSVTSYFSDYNFKPSWNNSQYTLDLFTDFNDSINGGTVTSLGTGFRIYRNSEEDSKYMEVATLPLTTTRIKDYGIKSNNTYTYYFYAYDSLGAFTGVRTSEVPIKKQFTKYSLLATEYNSSDHCYHVVKEYLFSCNLTDEVLSNNSNKSYVQNFTPYPTVFRSSANYSSGTLQALIGFVDKTTYRYWDDSRLMTELNGLSTTDYTLFLRDMKGHLWMVDVGTVQQTVKYGTREMQVTISLPWTEIGDAAGVSIIQTPDDEGWDNDAQVLDVKLDVDVDTGLLYAAYPFPYNGTAFYLVGVTPEGVVSAVQPLPNTLSNPTDGQLKAVVRHK